MKENGSRQPEAFYQSKTWQKLALASIMLMANLPACMSEEEQVIQRQLREVTKTAAAIFSKTEIAESQKRFAATEKATTQEANTGEVIFSDIAVGDQVEVYGTGTDRLRIRQNPGLGADAVILHKVYQGTVFFVIGGPIEEDGYTWWNVSDASGNIIGWAAGIFLKTLP